MIIAHILQAVTISTLGILLARENKRRDRLQESQAGGLEGRDLNSTAFSDMTDKENPKLVAGFYSNASLFIYLSFLFFLADC